MNILDRIKKLEEEVKCLRIIDSEDIVAEDTGLGIALHLEDPFMDESSGDSYEGYFKVVDFSDGNTQQVIVFDGGFEPEDAPAYAGYAIINDVDMPIGKHVLTITGTAYIYAEFVAILNSDGDPVGIDNPAIMQSAERQVPEDNKVKVLLAIVDWNAEASKIQRVRQMYYGGEIYRYIFKICAEAAASSSGSTTA